MTHFHDQSSQSVMQSLTAFAIAMVLVFTCQHSVRAEAKPQVEPLIIDLLARTDSFPGKTWTHFSGQQGSNLSDTWKIGKDPETSKPMLICTGEPYGYLATVKHYRNFELTLEWKYPEDANGNSGVFLFIHGEHKLWPSAVQVQLYQPEAGVTFGNGGMKPPQEIRKVPMLAKPVNHWNHCRVRCVEGTLQVAINGQSVGEISGCRPMEGAIGLQSEGAVVHFRNFILKEIPSQESILKTDTEPVTKEGDEKTSSAVTDAEFIRE